MNNIEIIVLVFIALSIVKLITLIISPRAWYGPSNPIIRLVWNKISATIFALIFGGIVLFYLLMEISIVEVFVAVVFAFLLAILTLAPDIKKIFEGMINHLERDGGILKKYWFSLLIWLGLMTWVVWEIFIL